MAVFPTLPGLEITVIDADGNAFEEWEDDDSESEDEAKSPVAPTAIVDDGLPMNDTDFVFKYIEARTGQEFGIKYVLKAPFRVDCPTLSFVTYIDGKLSTSPMHMFGPGDSHAMSDIVMGVEEDELIKPYRFLDIKSSIDERDLATIKEDTQRISKLGQIMVCVRRKGEAALAPNLPLGYMRDHNDELEVHEKSLKGKAKSHGVSLGQARAPKSENELRVTWTAKTLDKYPIAQACFRYRSREALKQLLVIPRTPEQSVEPEPEPPRGVREDTASLAALKIEDLDEVERRMIEEFRQRRAGGSMAPRVKRERDNNVSSGATRSKKARNSGTPVFIDLTDD